MMSTSASDTVRRKYSKSSAFYFDTKGSFFSNNDALLAKAHGHNRAYASQGLRESCKLCGASLAGEADFISHGVPYRFCNECTHLNGLKSDTEAFVRSLYVDDGGKAYAANYLNAKYEGRVNDILHLDKIGRAHV